MHHDEQTKEKILIFTPKSTVAVDASLLSAEGFSVAAVAFSFTGMFLNLEYKSFFSVQIERKEIQIGVSVHEAKKGPLKCMQDVNTPNNRKGKFQTLTRERREQEQYMC